MGGFLRSLVATLMLLSGVLLMAAGIFGFVFSIADQTTSLVIGGLGFFLVILAGAWLAVK